MDQTDRELDHLFKWVDEAFLDGNFECVDTYLKDLRLEEWSTDLLVGHLSICHGARKKIPHYSAFLVRMRHHLELIEPDRVEALMKGFEV